MTSCCKSMLTTTSSLITTCSTTQFLFQGIALTLFLMQNSRASPWPVPCTGHRPVEHRWITLFNVLSAVNAMPVTVLLSFPSFVVYLQNLLCSAATRFAALHLYTRAGCLSRVPFWIENNDLLYFKRTIVPSRLNHRHKESDCLLRLASRFETTICKYAYPTTIPGRVCQDNITPTSTEHGSHEKKS